MASEPRVEEALADPAVSFPLKVVLRGWLDRDCVDAARDARLLCELLQQRADAAFGSPA